MKAGAGVWYFLKSLIAAIIASLAWIDGAGAVEAFALPDALSANDDGSSAAVPIGFPINFWGVTHTALFVNNNGNVTFGVPLSAFTPFGLVGTRQAIIAPFFGDEEIRSARGVHAQITAQARHTEGAPVHAGAAVSLG